MLIKITIEEDVYLLNGEEPRWAEQAWQITIKNTETGASTRFPYFGGAKASAPTVADIIEDQQSNADATLLPFTEWAEELGFNPDSIADHNVYETSRGMGNDFTRVVGFAWRASDLANYVFTDCECGNETDPGYTSCEWCEAHADCERPAGIVTGYAPFGGAYVAKCTECNYVCGYWDCACELVHDCETAAVSA